ncbi:MAG: hypothetical protein RMI91_03430 [Gemmatales bacterium]|nr:hypothetical protein [Gemmatales bacterium]MDW7993683.1 hypothetical protein [Gemmatales bacterium]
MPDAHGQVRIEAVHVGFVDKYTGVSYGRFGHWLPVRVVVASGGVAEFQGYVTVSMPDADGIVHEAKAEELIQLSPAKPRQAVWAYVPCGHGKLRVQVRDAQERTVASLTHPDDLGQTHLWHLIRPAISHILALGDPAGLHENAAAQESGPDPGYRVCHLDTPQYLPERWFGYDSVQAIVLATGGSAGEPWLQALRDRPALAQALRQWVQQGGHLVVSVAERANWLAQAGRFPLADMLPGDWPLGRQVYPELLVGIREVTATRHREPTALPTLRTDWAEFRKKPTATQRAFAADPLKPAVLVWPYGLGQVTLLTWDTNVGPFTRWSGRKEFWEWLLETEPLPARQAFRTTLTMQREPEPLTQLIHPLEQFQTEEIPFSHAAGFMFLYLLLAGPVDYLITVRWLRRPAWAWLTFPLMVMAVTLAAWLSAWAIHGDQLAVHELVVYDLELEASSRGATRVVRGSASAWLVLKSPQLAAYSLGIGSSASDATATISSQPAKSFPASVREAVLGWAVRPDDDALQRGQRESLVQGAVRIAPGQGRLTHLPMQAWSVKTLFARWLLHWDVPPTLAEARLRAPDLNTIRGELVWHGAWPLLGSELTFGIRVWPLGDLQPGHKVQVQRNDVALLDRQRLQSAQISRVEAEVVTPATAVDPNKKGFDSLTLVETLRRLTFQRLFMANRRQAAQPYLPYLDQSKRLRQGQAVLSGYLPVEEMPLNQLSHRPSLSSTLGFLEPALPGKLRRLVFVRLYIPLAEQD